jgi:hypothetical protein
MQAEPIPRNWLDRVLPILVEREPTSIEWSYTAENDWQSFGLEQDAYDLILKELRKPEVLGHRVVNMRDRRDGTYTDCWGFFCEHPWGSSVPLYAKIGVHHSRVYINLFSLHVDDGSEQLKKAIEAYKGKAIK